jgi:4-hydroxy-2-oxoheptanedioate aldolase
VATPGLGGIYVGPADLSLAYGYASGFDRTEPEMLEIIERIRGACQAQGIAAGIHCGDPDYARRMVEKGFELVTIGSDARFIEAGARTALKRLRETGERADSKAPRPQY